MTMRGSLSLPEGVAAAEVLKVGSHMKSYGYCAAGIKELLKGSGIAGLITFFMSRLHILSTSMTVWFSAGRAVTQIPLGFSPALVGVGYLLGAVSGVTMLIGLVIAWGGFVPYITLTEPIPDGMGLAQFADMIFVQKVRLIGAGAMGVAALWTLLTLTFSRAVLREVKEAVMDAQSDSAPMRTAHRTDADLSMRTLGIIFWVTIAGLLLIFYSFISPEHLPPVQKVLFTVTGVSLAVVSGFLVTAAAAYMSGLVGTSSSPLSGVGILGIVVSSLLMYALCCDFGIFDIPNGKRLGAAIARGNILRAGGLPIPLHRHRVGCAAHRRRPVAETIYAELFPLAAHGQHGHLPPARHSNADSYRRDTERIPPPPDAERVRRSSSGGRAWARHTLCLRAHRRRGSRRSPHRLHRRLHDRKGRDEYPAFHCRRRVLQYRGRAGACRLYRAALIFWKNRTG